MPSFTDTNGKRRNYATEEELLEFANKMREAGDAKPLEALMPSVPQDEKSCLIANAVNFRSTVLPVEGGKWPDGTDLWVMIPERVGKERLAKIAEAVGCPLIEVWTPKTGGWLQVERPNEEDLNWFKMRTIEVIRLPKDIGLAANAFDQGEGWTVKYNINVERV